MAMSKRATWAVGVGLVLLAMAGRWFSETPNFTPVAAVALFAGVVLRDRRAALLVPIAAMALSDVLWEGWYDWRLMAVVYGALAFPVLLRRAVGERCAAWRVAGASLAGSVVFFLSTNLAEWLFMGHYPPTGAGLAACFAAALPFFKYTLGGDLLWNAVLFGGLVLVSRPSARGATMTHSVSVAAAR